MEDPEILPRQMLITIYDRHSALMPHSLLITLECDFEESHLCGYSNQWNANVNWYVGGGRTQLLHNNIPNDHTFNNNTGKIWGGFFLFKFAA